MEPGDVDTFIRLTNPDHYMQHSAQSPDGQAATAAMYPMVVAKAHAKVARAFQDGNFAVVHADLKMFSQDMVTFQIWRFENGLAVEHWENTQPTAGPNSSGHTMTDGATEITNLDKTDANKALVEDMLNTVFIGGAYDRLGEFVSTVSYVQHSPGIADGIEGLAAAGDALKDLQFIEVRRVLGQGNFVLSMSEITLGKTPAAAYPLFRVADGKIVEHWDVIAPIEPKADWKNPNGKF
jgi:predicted SnoaL-like aldol condensation-catalyzing enzyme